MGVISLDGAGCEMHSDGCGSWEDLLDDLIRYAIILAKECGRSGSQAKEPLLPHTLCCFFRVTNTVPELLQVWRDKKVAECR